MLTLILIQLALPLGVLLWLALWRHPTRVAGALAALLAGSLFALLHLAGLWLVLPWYLPAVYGLLGIRAAAVAWRRLLARRSAAWETPGTPASPICTFTRSVRVPTWRRSEESRCRFASLVATSPETTESAVDHDMMRYAFAVLLGIHGLLHLLGATKVFGWADVPQFRQPLSPTVGALWLVAAILLAGAAIGVARDAHWWWWAGLPGIVLSQALISQSWGDSRFGTVVNLMAAVPLLLLAVDARPDSFRSRFARDRDALLARPGHATRLVTEADLASLPPLMSTYLRRVGAVGRPHVRNFRVRFDARMRSSATSPWMPATATQYESFDPPARLFYMNATRGGVPLDIFHRYVDGAASFQVRIASLFPMVDKRGPVLTRAETVTLMNDIVVMAPAAVLDLPFTWTTDGEHSVLATFTNAGNTVAARLRFDAAGDLVGFLSNDRTQEDAGSSRNLPWSTPITRYRTVDGIRIGSHGDANWVDPSGEWTYGSFDIRSISYNVSVPHDVRP